MLTFFPYCDFLDSIQNAVEKIFWFDFSMPKPFCASLFINDAIRTRRVCLCTFPVSVLDGKQTSSEVSDIPIALFTSPHRWHHISHDVNRKLSQLNLRAQCVIYNANVLHNFIKSDLIWCVRTYLLPYHFAHLATTTTAIPGMLLSRHLHYLALNRAVSTGKSIERFSLLRLF